MASVEKPFSVFSVMARPSLSSMFQNVASICAAHQRGGGNLKINLCGVLLWEFSVRDGTRGENAPQDALKFSGA
jgi:hypothetical protein